MKRILAVLTCLMLALGALSAVDMHIDSDSGVQSEGFFALYLESEDQRTILYINVTPTPTADTITGFTLMIDGEKYVPQDLLWYRQDGYFASPFLIENLASSFTTYAEVYDSHETGVEQYMGYYHEELQCFGGPDDLIWSLLMDKKLDIKIYDEWGYELDEFHFTVLGDTKKLLSLFSNFINYSFNPQF